MLAVLLVIWLRPKLAQADGISGVLATTFPADATAISNQSTPFIVNGPSSDAVTQRNNAVFSVTATGTEALSYQWRFDGMNLPDNIIGTVAGNGSCQNGSGVATSASLSYPNGVAADASGNLFIADTANGVILKVTATGVITTVAGGGSEGYGDGIAATDAQLNNPQSVTVDAFGNLFFADKWSFRIREVTTNGIISTVAGNGNAGYAGGGSVATYVGLDAPSGAAIDAFGNLFIADTWNSRIWEVNTNGMILPVAGNGSVGYAGDGRSAVEASLNYPNGVAVDAAGTVFIADTGNNVIRAVTSQGVIMTVAGNGIAGYTGDGGAAASASLNYPNSVAVDAADDLFIADENNNAIRKVTPGGLITTIAGNGNSGDGGDGGAAINATLDHPSSVAVDPLGNLFITDEYNNCVRKVTANGLISTVAGNRFYNYSGMDGAVTVSAGLNYPFGVTADNFGNVFIADSDNNCVREVTTNGLMTTVAGSGIFGYSGDGGAAPYASLNYPLGVAVDQTGNLYIADGGNNCIRKVTANGLITTVAGNGTPGYSGDGAAATNATLGFPYGVTVDAMGNLFIADSDNNVVREVSLNGIITTAAGDGLAGYSGDGAAATNACLSNPASVAVDAAGDLFIADSGNNVVREVTADGLITTVAGDGSAGYSGDGAAATNACLSNPASVAVDATGDLFIADSGNNVIREVTAAGLITTVAGDGTAGFSGDGGAPLNASLYYPYGVAVDTSGNLFIADCWNNVIREVRFGYSHESKLTLNNVTINQGGSYSVVVTSGTASANSSNAILTVFASTNTSEPANALAAPADWPHYVFAHYMVCYSDYGQTVDGFKQDILDAQAAGIDGFALNVNAYNDPTQPYYNTNIALMYDAAEQLGTGFKLFFSVNYSGESNIVNMVETYARRTNTFTYHGRVVLSAYGENDVPSQGWPGLDWTNAILGQLAADGYPVYFVPYFFSDPVSEIPSHANAMEVTTNYANLVDGLFCWTAAGLPSELATANSNYIAAVHSAGKLVMAGIAPNYWGSVQYGLGRRYYETDGGEGLTAEWLNIIANQPDAVEIGTWNDFNESTYVSPIENPGQYEESTQTPVRYSHKGYLELSKRYIAWYKTGNPPPLNQDAIFYFYRTHGMNLPASNINEILVGWRTGDIADLIYTTVYLTAPASLEIVSGTNGVTNSLPAGISNVRTPFASGTQQFTLRRDHKTVATVQGPNIWPEIQYYDFFPASGYAYADSTNSDLRIAVQPASQPATYGSSATFKVTAVGAGSLSYQWWFNGSPIAEGTNAVLVVTNIQAGNIGVYAVTVNNQVAQVTSQFAMLSLVTPLSNLNTTGQPSNGSGQ